VLCVEELLHADGDRCRPCQLSFSFLSDAREMHAWMDQWIETSKIDGAHILRDTCSTVLNISNLFSSSAIYSTVRARVCPC
jgi:hypothetical protein